MDAYSSFPQHELAPSSSNWSIKALFAHSPTSASAKTHALTAPHSAEAALQAILHTYGTAATPSSPSPVTSGSTSPTSSNSSSGSSIISSSNGLSSLSYAIAHSTANTLGAISSAAQSTAAATASLATGSLGQLRRIPRSLSLPAMALNAEAEQGEEEAAEDDVPNVPELLFIAAKVGCDFRYPHNAGAQEYLQNALEAEFNASLIGQLVCMKEEWYKQRRARRIRNGFARFYLCSAAPLKDYEVEADFQCEWEHPAEWSDWEGVQNRRRAKYVAERKKVVEQQLRVIQRQANEEFTIRHWQARL